MRRILVLLICCTAIASSGIVSNIGSGESGRAAGEWTTRSPLPEPRISMGMTSLDGLIYVLGGYNSTSYHPSSDVLVYDPYSDKWSNASPMQKPRTSFSAVACGGLIYAINGANDSDTTVEAYNPKNDTWFFVNDSIQPHKLAAVATVNGIIYLIGGWLSRSDVEAYNPQNDTWWSVAPLHNARQMTTAVTVNGHIYVIGGYQWSIALTSMEIYDSKTNTWTEGPPMAIPRSGPAATAVGSDYIIVVGGGTPSGGSPAEGSISTTEIYNVANKTWSRMADIPTPRYYMGAAIAKGNLYAIGGKTSQAKQDRNEALDLSNIMDAVPPELTVSNPVDSTWIGVSTISFEGHVFDSGDLLKVEASLDGENWTNCTVASTSWSTPLKLEFGDNYLFVRAYDTNYNRNLTKVFVTVDAVFPVLKIVTPKDQIATADAGALFQGTAFDDRFLTKVEASLNNGPWKACKGLEAWNITLVLTTGSNLIRARAIDKAGNTNMSMVTVVLDDVPPTVTIDMPSKTTVSKPAMTLTGKAADNMKLQKVEICTGGSEWTNLGMKANWSANITLRQGLNNISIRATDILGNEDTAYIDLIYKKPEKKTPGFGGEIVLLILVVAVFILGFQRKTGGNINGSGQP